MKTQTRILFIALVTACFLTSCHWKNSSSSINVATTINVAGTWNLVAYDVWDGSEYPLTGTVTQVWDTITLTASADGAYWSAGDTWDGVVDGDHIVWNVPTLGPTGYQDAFDDLHTLVNGSRLEGFLVIDGWAFMIWGGINEAAGAMPAADVDVIGTYNVTLAPTNAALDGEELAIDQSGNLLDSTASTGLTTYEAVIFGRSIAIVYSNGSPFAQFNGFFSDGVLTGGMVGGGWGGDFSAERYSTTVLFSSLAVSN